MKNNTFLSMALVAVLMVALVGCTTMQGAQDEYYETSRVQSAPSRVYVDDPYNYGRTIVMERDPYTGRYYEVGSTGIYNNSISTYDPRYNNTRINSNRRYDNRRYNSGYPSRGQVVTQQPQRPTEADRQQTEEKRKEAKDAIFGKKN